MRSNSSINALFAMILASFAWTAGGCKEGSYLKFWVSPESAKVIRQINERLRDRAADLALECFQTPSSRTGRIACLLMTGSTAQTGLFIEEIGDPFHRKNAPPVAVRISGGSQQLQQAIYESLAGTTPQLHRTASAGPGQPEIFFEEYKLFLEDQQLEIRCTYTPSHPTDQAYWCVTIVATGVLSAQSAQ